MYALGSPTPTRRRALVGGLVALAGYAGLTVLYTLPLSAHLGTHMPDYAALGVWVLFAAADAYLCYWIIAWDAHALATRPLHVFDANILYPAPSSLAGAENLLGYTPVAAPLYWATGNPVLSAHVAMLASYVLGALGMFLLVRRWAGRLPAFVAGLAYAFAPWRTPNVNMLAVLGTHAFPFLVLATEQYLEAGTAVALMTVVAMIVVSAFTSVYWGYAAFLLLGTHVLVRFRLLYRRPRRAAALAGAAVVGALLCAPIAIPYLRLRRFGVVRSFAPGTFPVDLLPSLIRDSGLPPLALGLVALTALLRLRRRAAGGGGSGAWSLAFAMVGVGCLFSLGSRLVFIAAPNMSVPLPYALFARVVPGFTSARVPIRFFTLAGLGLAMMVGLALEEARRLARARGTAVVSVLAVLLVGELAWHRRPLPITPAPVGPRVPAVYRYLREHGEGGPLLELPASGLRLPYQNARAMYFSTVHWLPLLNGHTGHAPPTMDFLLQRAARLPAADALQEIVDLVDLRWILVHGAELRTDQTNAWLQLPPGLQRVGEFDGDALYAVSLRPDADLRMRFRNWYAASETLTGTSLDPLPAPARRGRVTSATTALATRAGRALPVRLVVRNLSETTWPGYGVTVRGLVTVRGRWLVGARPGAASREGEFMLPADVRPGEAVTLTITADTSSLAPGHAVLELALAQDGIDFPRETAPPLHLPVDVSRDARG